VKTAVYTMVKNEDVFLPLWLKHYSKYFKNIHVLNNNTTDGSVEKAHKKFDFTEHKITKEINYGIEEMRNMGIDGQRMLFEKYGYDLVVFAEADEFIVADPDKYSGLDDFVLQMKSDYVFNTGKEVLQLDNEKAIDWDKPILAQRSVWWPHPSYHKPTISKIPLNWVDGFHYLEETVGEFNNYKKRTKNMGLGEYIKAIACPDVYMIHLQKVDWETFCNRGRFKKDKDHFHIGMGEKEKIPKKWKKIL